MLRDDASPSDQHTLYKEVCMWAYYLCRMRADALQICYMHLKSTYTSQKADLTCVVDLRIEACKA